MIGSQSVFFTKIELTALTISAYGVSSRGFLERHLTKVTRSGYSVARFAETALGAAALVAPGIEEPTNTASGSNEDEDEPPLDPVVVISNDKSTEFFLATVVEDAA